MSDELSDDLKFITSLVFGRNFIFKPSFQPLLQTMADPSKQSPKMQHKLQLWDIMQELCTKPIDCDLLQNLMDQARHDLDVQWLPATCEGMAPLIRFHDGWPRFSLHYYDPAAMVPPIVQLNLEEDIDEELLFMSFLVYDFLQITFN